ncbi:MAG: enoyl-CoA hydratase/isomerase family protein [Thermomicrobiales bacterium]
MPGVIPHFRFQYELDSIRSIDPDVELPEVVYEVEPPLAYVTLNRPERRNAFNDALYIGLFGGLHRALLDDTVRVVIVRGAGQGFSAGHDLTSPTKADGLPEETPPVPPTFRPTVADYFNFERRRCQKYEELLGYPKLVIAQVHGFCIGAGAFVQSACDFTYAAEDARFGTRSFAHQLTGIVAVDSGWPGRSHTLRGGSLDEVSGARAAEIGLINGAFPSALLDENVKGEALRLAALPLETVARIKQWYAHLWDTAGLGLSYRAHYQSHTAAQWIRHRPGENNFYKVRGQQGLSGYFRERAASATPGGDD